MDDAGATVAGGWTSVKVFGATATAPAYYGVTGSDTNSFGTNYLAKSAGNGSAWVQFTPNIRVAGNYDVYQWHPYVVNASAMTPFVITGRDGTNTVRCNQQTNSGNWSWVGRFNFSAGTSGNVRVTDDFSDAANLALADGLKLVFAADEVVLDNTNAEVSYTGSWSVGSSAAGRYQADYRFASSAPGGTATAVYRPKLANAGLYDVFIWYPAGANRATNAAWLVSGYGSVTNVLVNQQNNGGFWLPIARAFPLAEGTNGTVQLSNNAGPSVVLADAVRFTFVAPLVPPVMQSIIHQADGRVKLTMAGLPGGTLQLESATNLAGWQPLTNLLNSTGTVIFTDDRATNKNVNFYRARQ